MGRAKQEWEEFDGLGMSVPNSKDVCSHHIDDYGIKEFILKNDKWGYCEYCNSRRKVIDTIILIKFIGKQVGYFFDSADNECISYDSSEGGYLGPTLDGDEVLEECGLDVDNEELRKDIYSCFWDQVWCKINPFDPNENKILLQDWEKFTETVKHKSRYVFLQSGFNDSYYDTPIHKILDSIGRKVQDLKLFRAIKTNTEIYRCRQHQKIDDVKSAKDITSPPIERVTYSNRMSPAGISMFYGTFDSKTAIAETVDFNSKANLYYTIGTFLTKRELNLIDLTNIPKSVSVFDEKWGKYLHSILFMKDFVTDLSKDIIRDGKEHYEYAPTQIVTEFFRYSFKENNGEKIDGIIYPSAKNKGKNAFVLFFDNNASLDVLEYVAKTQKTKRI